MCPHSLTEVVDRHLEDAHINKIGFGALCTTDHLMH